MSKLYSSNRFLGYRMSSIIVILFVAVLGTVFFMPRGKERKYSYEIDKPWLGESVIAEFDYPIYKTDADIKSENDSIINNFMPYFMRMDQVSQQQIKLLHQRFPNGIDGLSQELMRVLYDRVGRLYDAGILDGNVLDRMGKDSLMAVRIISQNNAEVTSINDLYTVKSAYEQLLQDDKLKHVAENIRKADIVNYIKVNLSYDKKKNESELNDILSTVARASGMVRTGEMIISMGEIVTNRVARKLDSYNIEIERRNDNIDMTKIRFGQLIYVAFLLILFTLYLKLFRIDYLNKLGSATMLYTLVIIFPILMGLMLSGSFIKHHVYALPFALVPMFIRVFMDSRTAFVAHVITILICAIMMSDPSKFLITQLITGLVAVYSLRELSKRAQLFKTALLVTLTSLLIDAALLLMQNKSVLTFEIDHFKNIIFNGVLLLLAYPLMYLIERTFGFISNVTLFELSNTNKGLLLNMSDIAPGTFQHSITVGNLAAEIAKRIGADSLLVRTGALYHDIGKMKKPIYFTENQVGFNPHEGLPYKESSRIIVEHITEGVKMAEKENLPNFIKDFILTHHGTGETKYFYIKYCNEHPDEQVDIKDFSYPGPDPFTREQAILMMADTVEAASRSLPDYSEESISNLVHRLIDAQLHEGHFKDCPITFRDIAQAKDVLIERLKSIYHTRIAYPKLNQTEDPTPTQTAKSLDHSA